MGKQGHESAGFSASTRMPPFLKETLGEAPALPDAAYEPVLTPVQVL